MGRLDDKVAIVTGAGGGQGAAEAKLLAKEGAKVVVTDVAFENVQNIAKEINEEFPGSAIALKHDVASEENWQEVTKKAIEEFGKINVLVNNAGVLATKSYEEVDQEYFQFAMNINTWGQFVGIKTVAPYMKENGGGSIINIGSLASVINAGGFNPYTASKGAVEALSRSAAAEFGPFKIRVNSVHPGSINTKMLTDTVTTQEGLDAVAQMIPLRRHGEPVDVAKLVLFLASDDSEYITADRFIIDGGMWVQ
ncbi:SDR family NAD(P)-dependent oxidoreductase [Oceanobacillus saliphilus]|uniref:SDR family NAD(P)-dependent oxidoreductase n=1 Tax=Oceanobacillus saliphilus TaxID=2925834 RepID=UPI00201D5E40|nr:SDR family oxidoreductase [Oceanobacillus saliphilus]